MKKYLIACGALILSMILSAQSKTELSVNANIKYQELEGFGAALAYYENWLTAHPNKAEIYEAIFNELSLDILRVRNAHEYDETMIDRVSEFYSAAVHSLGHPIKVLSTSWGPPARLKSNNDEKNGGTLRYEINEGVVQFDYDGFADWWGSSLDEYNQNGIYPDFISIQNEPDYSATWESCLLDPDELITADDTIAGYDKALEAVYAMVESRNVKPRILGPESIGIGYNSVENYVRALDDSKIYGIAHHLYHGVDQDNPWESTAFSSVGNFKEDIPHFQTEFSGGDWFFLGALIYKSLRDENAVAYLYWDLIWDGAGLVSLDNPWDQNSWETDNGYVKNKEFYAFKQYSAFLHPRWKRINATSAHSDIKTLAFMSPDEDTVSWVMINKSITDSIDVSLTTNNLSFNSYVVYRTSENEDCAEVGKFYSPKMNLPPKSITTVQMTFDSELPLAANSSKNPLLHLYPNPVSDFLTIESNDPESQLESIMIFDLDGRMVKEVDVRNSSATRLEVDCSKLKSGLYLYHVKTTDEELKSGRFLVE